MAKFPGNIKSYNPDPMARIFAIGETVYDIIFKNEQPLAAKAGGSMLNTSVSLGRLGLDVNFISDLGKDTIGDFVVSFLSGNGVSSQYIERYENRKTAIAIAFLDENNDASYTFYKDFPEKRFSSLEIDFRAGDIVLFGSFFALTESVRPALLHFLERAREKGCIIMYDPNFRKPHLHELNKLRPYIAENIAFSDMVRASDEDFRLVFGVDNALDAFGILKENGCNNLVYTATSKEVCMMSDDLSVSQAVPVIKPVSTIGAGDNFNAGIIWMLVNQRITKAGMNSLPESIMRSIVASGISFATEVCMSFDNYVSNEFASRLNLDRRQAK